MLTLHVCYMQRCRTQALYYTCTPHLSPWFLYNPYIPTFEFLIYLCNLGHTYLKRIWTHLHIFHVSSGIHALIYICKSVNAKHTVCFAAGWLV